MTDVLPITQQLINLQLMETKRINDNINRLVWRFSQGKSFMPNSSDIDALNSIIEWVNNTRKEEPKKNNLFAKLYVWVYGEFLKHYEATVFDSEPQKELSRILEKPLKSHYIEFWNNLNANENYVRFKTIESTDESIKKTYPVSDQEIEDIKKNFDKLTEEEKKHLFEDKPFTWIDTVDNLNTMVTEALNRFE